MRYVDLGLIKQNKLKFKKKKRLFKIGILVLGFLITFLIFKTGVPNDLLLFIRGEEVSLKSTSGRTNILILGIDKRSSVPYTVESKDGLVKHVGFLADTIILLSINRNTKEATLISIPRDLWVKISGWDNVRTQEGKINSSYSLGERFDYPGGGLALVKQVTSENLGVPVHYGLRIDFSGFRKMIDTLGRIDVNVDNSFDDYNYPIEGKEDDDCGGDPEFRCRFERIRFEKGLNNMNGETALKFVRSRTGTNNEGSDFARATRQQKVIIAIRDKALSKETVFDPGKVAKLISDFGETIESDINVSALPALFNLSKEISFERIKTFVLDNSSDGVLTNPPKEDYQGLYVLIPKDRDWNKLRAFVKGLLAGSVVTKPTVGEKGEKIE